MSTMTLQTPSGTHTPLSLTLAATGEPESSEGPEKAAWLDAAPWWAVSVLFHGLGIALAGLLSLAIELPRADESLIIITELQPAAQIKPESEEKAAVEKPSALESKSETPPTDPTSKDQLDVIVPPDIMAKAELGDHFETINLDRPDTGSAFGNPDAHMFHSVQGNSEPEGGGGVGGAGLDELIGVGGSASPGSGGGWGGGHGTGSGVGTGSGRGSFGNRNGGGRKLMVKRHGGGQATENAVAKALRWLAYHQEPDGHWDTRKYEGSDKWGMKDGHVDAGVTGLALLAFLGAGHTEKIGEYRDNVRRAVAWIISQQDKDGFIGRKYAEYWHEGSAYHHAICGMALAEAGGMAHVKDTLAAAQKAVNYSTEVHQQGKDSDKGAWRYAPNAPMADASVSGWFVMQLKSAKIAGLAVNHASFEGALKFYDSIENKEEVNGYKGGRFPYSPQHKKLMLNPTAIGILCNLFCGRKSGDLLGGAEYLAQNLPRWDPTLGQGKGHCFTIYYTYYATLTMFQIGGDFWKKWNAALKDMLLPKQRADGDFAGSWDPLGGSDDVMGGRVYMTAMSALCLEVYYRYALLNAGN